MPLPGPALNDGYHPSKKKLALLTGWIFPTSECSFFRTPWTFDELVAPIRQSLALVATKVVILFDL
jgi:hypothetical protein